MGSIDKNVATRLISELGDDFLRLAEGVEYHSSNQLLQIVEGKVSSIFT